MMRSLLFLSLVFPAMLISVAPVFPEEASIDRVQFRMVTYARVLIYGGTNAVADAAFSEIRKLDELLSD